MQEKTNSAQKRKRFANKTKPNGTRCRQQTPVRELTDDDQIDQDFEEPQIPERSKKKFDTCLVLKTDINTVVDTFDDSRRGTSWNMFWKQKKPKETKPIHRNFEVVSMYRSFAKEMHLECRKIRQLRNQCFCRLLLILIYCGIGGFLFKFVEGTFETYYKCGVKRVKRDFIDTLWTKSYSLPEEDWKSLAIGKLRKFEEELHTAHEAGMRTYSGQKAWSFLNSVVYSLTVITSIGYGHIYPETKTGKALTIVYAIIGIPLFLLALTDFGKLFTRCIKFLWSFVRRLYYTGSCRRARKSAHVDEIFKGAQMVYEIATLRRPSTFQQAQFESGRPAGFPAEEGDSTPPTTPAMSHFEIDDEFNLPISLALFILIVYMLLGGLIYCLWEGWDFFDSFYFVFISMSTVGFGDMVPDDAICMIVSIVYLVFGLALMSMCINVVQVKISDSFKQASDKLGATIGFMDNGGNTQDDSNPGSAPASLTNVQ